MSVPPEHIQVGKCYLVQAERSKQSLGVRRVVRIMADGRVQFEHRPARQVNAGAWKPGMQEARSFAIQILREVSSDWIPDADEERS